MTRQNTYRKTKKMPVRRSPKSEGVSSRQPSLSTGQKPLAWGTLSLPAVARSGAESEGWDIFRRPLDNIDKLSERAKTRNRQTQITSKDLPYQIIRQEADWLCIQLADSTFGWLPTKHSKQLKSSNYWENINYAQKNSVLPYPVLNDKKVDSFLKKLSSVPYLWGGTTKHGMDCSAFIQKLFFELFDILLPRNSREQKKQGIDVKKMSTLPSVATCPSKPWRRGERRTGRQSLQWLDILFFVHSSTGRHHVGVYWKNQVVHFCLDKKGLSTEPLSEMKKRYRHVATRRVLDFKKVPSELQANLNILDRVKAANNIHIVGVSGTEGAAIALFLQKQGINFTAHDFSPEQKFKRNFKANHFGYPAKKREKILESIQSLKGLKLQNNYLSGIEKADLIFVSQNWEAYAPNKKLKRIFQKNSATFATITQLYFQLFPGRIIAITGTNGKSTTAKLIAEIMKLSSQKNKLSTGQKKVSSGQKKVVAWFTGNDRRNLQILDCLDKWTTDDWLTIEVSNRQLKFPLGRSPEIGVITNVTPNHLDEYSNSMKKYKDCKYRLISNSTKQKIAVLNLDNPATQQFANKTKATVLSYSLSRPSSNGVYLKDGWIVVDGKMSTRQKKLSTRQIRTSKICRVDKIKLLGKHNLSNILAAVAATRAAGVNIKTIREAIENFQGIPQRLELVHQKRGVRYINDSASTTPDSTIAAIESLVPHQFSLTKKKIYKKNNSSDHSQNLTRQNKNGAVRGQGSVQLICGGDTKGMDYAKLATTIRRQKVQAIALESPLARALKKLLKDKLQVVSTLQEAVKIAVEQSKAGDSVLLSPAAAWFCYFNGKIPLGGRGFEKFVKILS